MSVADQLEEAVRGEVAASRETADGKHVDITKKGEVFVNGKKLTTAKVNPKKIFMFAGEVPITNERELVLLADAVRHAKTPGQARKLFKKHELKHAGVHGKPEDRRINFRRRRVYDPFGD